MYEPILTSLGLSPNEAKIYEALIEHGESSVSEISASAGIHRRNAYDAIDRLIEKGLCFQILSSTENRYNAVDPEKLTEILAEKRKGLNAILPDLKNKFGARHAPDEAYIYRGLEGQKNIFRDVLRVGEDSYFVGAKGGWFDPELSPARDAYFKEAKRLGIKFIQLFDHEAKPRMPDIEKAFGKMLSYRILPKEYSTNSAIHIFGDYVITYTGLPLETIPENTVFFVIHSATLADSYRTWFEYMWQRSEEPIKPKLA